LIGKNQPNKINQLGAWSTGNWEWMKYICEYYLLASVLSLNRGDEGPPSLVKVQCQSMDQLFAHSCSGARPD
jgi:hypothetical protein